MTSGIGVVRVRAREKDSPLEGRENVGPDDVDGLDKDVGPEDVEGLENEVNDGAEGVAEDWGLAACITAGSSELCQVIFTFLFLKVRKVAIDFTQDGGHQGFKSINVDFFPIEDPGLWHKYFLNSSFLIFFSINLIDLATQYNWILTPFQINFQGLTINFVGEMEDLGSFGQQTIQKGFVAACNIIDTVSNIRELKRNIG